jgi:hypothetical protein
MSLPGQMFDHMLNPVKGWPHMAALDFSAKISANVLYDMRAGQVAHINVAGELEPGVQLLQMGLFMFQGKNDFDVNNQRNDQWTPISPSGRVMVLVAKGGYELESTEADFTLAYNPNDHLQAPVGLGAGFEFISGVLTNAALGALYDTGAGTMKARVGVVSRGAFVNAYGKQVLAFWPIYLPGLV